MKAALDFSIIVPTYNRAESVQDTLQGIERQRLEKGIRFEIIVVDNNSSDGTKTVVKKLQKAFPYPLQYVFEPKQGIAHARNSGIKNAQGEFIAFLDDDVVPGREWLSSLWNCFKEEKADVIGGKIELLWLSQKPVWLSKRLMTPLVSSDYGEKRFQLNSNKKRFVGANLACRKSIFDTVGFFREELGRRGNSLIGGEDYEWFDRAVSAKAKIFYEPSAKVLHKVWAEKITEEYILRWFQDIGRTHGHLMDWKWHHGITILPVWCWKKTVSAVLQQSVSKLAAGDKTRRLEAQTEKLFYQGLLEERLSHWQSKLLHRRLSCHFV